MRGLNPKDIPTEGRYDFTITKSGSMKTATGDKVPAVACFIDNGPFLGKRMTATGVEGRVGDRFSAHVTPEAFALVGGDWVRVPLDYKETNPRIRYTLCDYSSPTAPAEKAFKSPAAKFHTRNV